MPIKHLPNIISFARLLLVLPFIYYFLSDKIDLALLVFACASLSDGLDGWIARFFNCQSRLGLIIDPIADKALIISCFILLGYKQYLNMGLITMVILRDVFILTGAFLSLKLLKKNYPLQPTIISKINTVLQMLLIVASLTNACFANIDSIYINYLSIIVAITTCASFSQYLYRWQRHLYHQY